MKIALHPFAVAYGLSCAAIYAIPWLKLSDAGVACEVLGATTFVWVVGFFLNFFVHLFYVAWLVERHISLTDDPEPTAPEPKTEPEPEAEPEPETEEAKIKRAAAEARIRQAAAGDAIMRSASPAGWFGFFFVRVLFVGVACVAIVRAETACVPQFLHLGSCALTIDSIIVLLTFAGTWIDDLLRRERESVHAKMLSAASETHVKKKKKSAKDKGE